jgi:hypothetical protein
MSRHLRSVYRCFVSAVVTAFHSARLLPTSTTSFRPRVTPV